MWAHPSSRAHGNNGDETRELRGGCTTYFVEWDLGSSARPWRCSLGKRAYVIRRRRGPGGLSLGDISFYARNERRRLVSLLRRHVAPRTPYDVLHASSCRSGVIREATAATCELQQKEAPYLHARPRLMGTYILHPARAGALPAETRRDYQRAAQTTKMVLLPSSAAATAKAKARVAQQLQTDHTPPINRRAAAPRASRKSRSWPSTWRTSRSKSRSKEARDYARRARWHAHEGKAAARMPHDAPPLPSAAPPFRGGRRRRLRRDAERSGFTEGEARQGACSGNSRRQAQTKQAEPQNWPSASRRWRERPSGGPRRGAAKMRARPGSRRAGRARRLRERAAHGGGAAGQSGALAPQISRSCGTACGSRRTSAGAASKRMPAKFLPRRAWRDHASRTRSARWMPCRAGATPAI